MDNWLQIVVTSVASVIASSGFWAYFQTRMNNRDGSSRLLLGLAYDKITSLGMSYIERGWITKDEFEEFRKYLYEPYKACGGNGMADRIMEDVSRLPLRSYSRYSEVVDATQRERLARHGRQNQDPNPQRPRV